MQQAIDICIQVREERENHIKAIEVARNKTIYDDGNKYIDTAISRKGKQEYDLFLTSIKDDVLRTIQEIAILQDKYKILPSSLSYKLNMKNGKP